VSPRRSRSPLPPLLIALGNSQHASLFRGLGSHQRGHRRLTRRVVVGLKQGETRAPSDLADGWDLLVLNSFWTVGSRMGDRD
jgi:hypothetical protein